MRKTVTLTVLTIFVALFAGCDGSSSDKDQKISNRISALQTAINGHDYDGYMICFDDAANMQASYTESAFDAEYPSGKTYSFGELTIADGTVTCDSTKSTTGTASYKNTFTMVESGDEWYISKWTEDTTDIFFNKKFRAVVQQ